MIRGLIGAAIWGAAALAWGVAMAPSAIANACAAAFPQSCLQSFGAGALAAESADGVEPLDCGAALTTYRSCIAEAIVDRDLSSGGVTLPPLSRTELGFLLALEAELAENVGRIGAFVEELDLTGAVAIYDTDWPLLRTKFFNATDNPSYFAAPADWLARAQAFYDELEVLLTRSDIREVYRRQATYALYDRKAAKDAFQALIAEGRDELLPMISAEVAAAGQ